MNEDQDNLGTDDDTPAEEDQADEEFGLLAEFWDFLKHNIWWWLTPLIIVVIVMVLLIVMNSSITRPFIYNI